jgi:hypothetical protein
MSAALLGGFAYPGSVLPPMATGVARARLDSDAHLPPVAPGAGWSANSDCLSPDNLDRTAIGVLA